MVENFSFSRTGFYDSVARYIGLAQPNMGGGKIGQPRGRGESSISKPFFSSRGKKITNFIGVDRRLFVC